MLVIGWNTLLIFQGWNINWLEITAIGTASATSAKANIAEINTISEDEYAIYPVPVRNNLNIKLADFENYSRVQILDMNSRNVAEQKINNGETTINVNSLTPGIYFVIIFDNNNNPVLNKKIIK